MGGACWEFDFQNASARDRELWQRYICFIKAQVEDLQSDSKPLTFIETIEPGMQAATFRNNRKYIENVKEIGRRKRASSGARSAKGRRFSGQLLVEKMPARSFKGIKRFQSA